MTVVNPKSISGITSITTGTGSDNLLTIHTGDTTERVRITSAGRLGVGENSPDTLLHLKDTTAASSKLITLNSSTVRNNYIGVTAADNLEIASDEDDEGNFSSIRFRIDGGEKVRITHENKVGIGTTNPAHLLHLEGASPVIQFEDTDNAANIYSLINAGGSAGRLLFQIDPANVGTDSYVRFDIDGDEKFKIASTGNVGINSTSPASKLDVIGDAKVSGIVTATSFVPTQGQLSNRNLIINGAMKIAQRATSSTDGDGYNTVDRYRIKVGGTDESPTQTQHALTSSDTGPWEEGFRHSWHFQNGDQTSGAGADDVIAMQHRIEAQNVACSGWDYASSSSYLTLSFWVKSSVAQNFYGHMRTLDGTAQNYPFETGSLSANTWTKITKVIPGNSNITMDNNNEYGIHLEWVVYRGTNQTGSVSLNTWAAYSSTARNPDCTSTWYTTNDSTFELTGVQLEVGAAATPFEHLIFSDELLRCQRYYQQLGSTDGNLGGDYTMLPGYTYHNGTRIATSYVSNVKMRTTPTIAEIGNGLAVYGQGTNANVATIFNINTATDTNVIIFAVDGDSSKDWGAIDHAMAVTNNTGGGMSFSAEF